MYNEVGHQYTPFISCYPSFETTSMKPFDWFATGIKQNACKKTPKSNKQTDAPKDEAVLPLYVYNVHTHQSYNFSSFHT